MWEKSTRVVAIDIYGEDPTLDNSGSCTQERLTNQPANRSENRFKDFRRGSNAIVDDMVLSGVGFSQKHEKYVEAATQVADFKCSPNSDVGKKYSSQGAENADSPGIGVHDDSNTEGAHASGPDSARGPHTSSVHRGFDTEYSRQSSDIHGSSNNGFSLSEKNSNHNDDDEIHEEPGTGHPHDELARYVPHVHDSPGYLSGDSTVVEVAAITAISGLNCPKGRASNRSRGVDSVHSKSPSDSSHTHNGDSAFLDGDSGHQDESERGGDTETMASDRISEPVRGHSSGSGWSSCGSDGGQSRSRSRSTEGHSNGSRRSLSR